MEALLGLFLLFNPSHSLTSSTGHWENLMDTTALQISGLELCFENKSLLFFFPSTIGSPNKLRLCYPSSSHSVIENKRLRESRKKKIQQSGDKKTGLARKHDQQSVGSDFDICWHFALSTSVKKRSFVSFLL